jgi:hypothetical protein
MNKQWIIFAIEWSGTHFWWDGHGVPLNLDHPVESLIWEDAFLKSLEKAMHTPRTKILVMNKTRYVVVARGTRYEP